MAMVGMRVAPASSTHVDAHRLSKFAALFVLAMSVSAPLADELPPRMITLPMAELAAMKARNVELWFDNYDLARELERVTIELERSERLLASSCGRWIKT